MHSDFTLTDCADDLVAILDDLGTQQATLVGRSKGGYVTQYAYLRNLQRVQSMVIVGATCIALPLSRWEMLALKATLPLFGLWPYGHFKRTIANNASIKPDVQACALQTVDKLSRDEFLRIWKAVTLAVDEQGIPGHHIRVPLLLTRGDQDTAGVIRRDAPKWAAYEPDVPYVVIPDAGHNANQDNAVYFNRVLVQFLRDRVVA